MNEIYFNGCLQIRKVAIFTCGCCQCRFRLDVPSDYSTGNMFTIIRKMGWVIEGEKLLCSVCALDLNTEVP